MGLLLYGFVPLTVKVFLEANLFGWLFLSLGLLFALLFNNFSTILSLSADSLLADFDHP